MKLVILSDGILFGIGFASKSKDFKLKVVLGKERNKYEGSHKREKRNKRIDHVL